MLGPWCNVFRDKEDGCIEVASGIGFELAKYGAEKDYDLIIAADKPQIETAPEKLRSSGAQVTAVQADLATREGVDKL